MAIAVCQGARIPRGLNHHTPHSKAIYHGHGATSYQNVQIQNHDSIPVPNNYVEHINNHHSFDHLNHDSLSIVNNYVEQEHHAPEHLTHLTIPIEKNYLDHDSADHYHSNGELKLIRNEDSFAEQTNNTLLPVIEIHQVQVIEEVPHVEHHSVETYIVPTLGK